LAPDVDGGQVASISGGNPPSIVAPNDVDVVVTQPQRLVAGERVRVRVQVTTRRQGGAALTTVRFTPADGVVVDAGGADGQVCAQDGSGAVCHVGGIPANGDPIDVDVTLLASRSVEQPISLVEVMVGETARPSPVATPAPSQAPVQAPVQAPRER